MYFQQSKCFWKRYNAAWPFRCQQWPSHADCSYALLGSSVHKLSDSYNRKQIKTKQLKQKVRGRTNKQTHVLTQQLTSLVSWRVAEHVTTWFSRFMTNSRWHTGLLVAEARLLSAQHYVPLPNTSEEQNFSHTYLSKIIGWNRPCEKRW